MASYPVDPHDTAARHANYGGLFPQNMNGAMAATSYSVDPNDTTARHATYGGLPPRNTSSAMAATPSYPVDPNDILSWTGRDCRESVLFNSFGVLYQFQTTNRNGEYVTTLLKSAKPNKVERIAKLEWAQDGGLGRIIIGKNAHRMSDLARPDPVISGVRHFLGPDGQQYRWRTTPSGNDDVLRDSEGNVIAFFRRIKETHYQIGDVFGELHFLRYAGMGTVMHPPMQDMVTLTAMLYRICNLHGFSSGEHDPHR